MSYETLLNQSATLTSAVDDRSLGAPLASSDAVIETHGLTKYFGTRKVVDSLTMAVPRGSVFAFLGRNGSGKTTTIRMLLGLTPPTRGSSRVLGTDSHALTPEHRARIGYMSESHTVYGWMTVAEAGAYQSRFYPRWNERIFRAITDHFRLSPRARARTLSRGERAGLSLALTLAPEPELLILDDPAIGLDPVARRSLLEAMIYVTRGSDRTILFSSHLLEDVERVATHVAVLDRSVLRMCCPIEAVQEHVRRFVLYYAGGTRPPELPPIRGLLHALREPGELQLTIASPDDATHQTLASLGAAMVDEVPLTFSDAMLGYLGDHDARGFFLEDTTALEAARAALADETP